LFTLTGQFFPSTINFHFILTHAQIVTFFAQRIFMIEILAQKTGLSATRIQKTLALFEQGATIPFIARYRKELTGGMDEVQLAELKQQYTKETDFQKRKAFVLESIQEQGKLSDELQNQIDACQDPAVLEDLYLPFKPKRNTKAEIARKKGLEPLAATLMAQKHSDIEYFAQRFVGQDKAESVKDALEGAGHIAAEWMSEHAHTRQRLRNLFERKAIIQSKRSTKGEDENETYALYYDFSEPVYKANSHRLLAIFRGENEKVLHVKIQPETELGLEQMERNYIKPYSTTEKWLKTIIKDAWKRLLAPSLENELRALLKEKADKKAIDIFSKNLEQLLMLPPMPGKRILAIDPGFRTGCKVVCLDENGNLLHNETIYPHPPQRETTAAMKKINTLVSQFQVDAIAIGNGTAGRETERFISRIRFNKDVVAVMVNENGASVYSASAVARKEFPQYDVTVRGAVSIGRRLTDPLSELVKIDPKAIGVGQYQHDVDQKALKESLDDVVMKCVNLVGVDIHSASAELLQYVSGLGPVLAKNIVDYRKEKGDILSRKELLSIPKLGPKAFEQCAGFIRVPQANNPLDNTAVHPESYGIVQQMAKRLKVELTALIRNETLLSQLNAQDFVTKEKGLDTIQDIITELKKPNRDPRQKIQRMDFDASINKVDDLKTGMKLPGIVTNITGFGAFVDLGVHQDGLIHISQMADGFVSDPHEHVSLNDYVEVEVLSIEKEKKRIGLKLLGKK
jgi:uncharacterized protein